ncbi:hypothetical protein EBZ38_17410, partial [bacterium]|nr:hypothetical protein [bacterium]NDD86040.1 hypothetical protein [bacterium]
PFFGGGGGAAASNMVGATTSVAGTAGLVPAPEAGKEGLFLRGDATFAMPLGKQIDFINATQKGFYLSPLFGDTGASSTMTNNLIYLSLFYVPAYTYTSILSRRSGGTTGSAQTIRMGMYNCNPRTLEPTTLVFNTAETNVFSLATDLSISISQTISAGLYYMAFITSNIGSGTYAATSINRTSYPQNIFLTHSASADYRVIPGLTYTHSGTLAAMPSDLTGSTFAFSGTGNACAYVQLKV